MRTILRRFLYTNSQDAQSTSLSDISLRSELLADNCQNHLTFSELGKTNECPICLQLVDRSVFVCLGTCTHTCCRFCVLQYLQTQITQSRVFNIQCVLCSENLHQNDIRYILCDLFDYPALFESYLYYQLRHALSTVPNVRWCPHPDCCYALIADTSHSMCPKLRCARCDQCFCYNCGEPWFQTIHDNMHTCHKSTSATEVRNVTSRASNRRLRSKRRCLSSAGQLKQCPRCKTQVVKIDDGSCNHITCVLCGSEFCWLCLREVSDFHYFRPSGCTFWGKKRWSKRKKFCWQLGTLLGAPLAISLVAALAVPGIVIGIPFWVCHRLHILFKSSKKHKLYTVMSSGLLFSILVSPALAILGVCIGVPVLFLYIYCIIPLSWLPSCPCLTDQAGSTVTSASNHLLDSVNSTSDQFMSSNGHSNSSQLNTHNANITSANNIDNIASTTNVSTSHHSRLLHPIADDSNLSYTIAGNLPSSLHMTPEMRRCTEQIQSSSSVCSNDTLSKQIESHLNSLNFIDTYSSMNSVNSLNNIHNCEDFSLNRNTLSGTKSKNGSDVNKFRNCSNIDNKDSKLQICTNDPALYMESRSIYGCATENNDDAGELISNHPTTFVPDHSKKLQSLRDSSRSNTVICSDGDYRNTPEHCPVIMSSSCTCSHDSPSGDSRAGTVKLSSDVPLSSPAYPSGAYLCELDNNCIVFVKRDTCAPASCHHDGRVSSVVSGANRPVSTARPRLSLSASDTPSSVHTPKSGETSSPVCTSARNRKNRRRWSAHIASCVRASLHSIFDSF